MLIFFWSFTIASTLEKCLFEEGNIEKAKEIPIVDPIDFTIKYFLTNTIEDDNVNATIMALSTDITNKYTSLLVARSLADSKQLNFSPVTKNALLRNAGHEIAESFFTNKYLFKDPILLSNLESKLDIKDILVNVWTMDELMLIKFYYLLEARLIKPTQAIEQLKYLAKHKQAYANVMLGNFYLYGLGVKKDLDKALEYFYAGKSDTSVSYLTGIGRAMMENNLEKSDEIIKIFKQAFSQGGDPEAGYCLFLLIDGKNDSKIFDEDNYLRDAAYAGYLPAVYKYSLLYSDSKFYEASNNSLMSVTQYFPKFQELEAKGIDAYQLKKYKQSALIFLYLSEFNLTHATKNAIYVLENYPSCLENSDILLFSKYNTLATTSKEYLSKIGDMYYHGKGVPQSYVDAFSSYLMARKYSDEAAYNLAYMYENGLGIPKDLKQAARIIKKHVKNNTSYLVSYYALCRICFKMAVCNVFILLTFVLGLGTTFLFWKNKNLA